VSDTQVAELNQRLQSAYGRLRAFYEAAQTINSTLELPEVLNRLVRSTAEAMHVHACSIRMLNDPHTSLDLVASYGLSEDYLKKHLALDVNTTMQSALNGELIIIDDATTDSRWPHRKEAEDEGIGSILIAPLLGKRHPLGLILTVSYEKKYFSQNDSAFLIAIASQGSIAIENAMAYQALSRLDEMKSKFVLMVTHELRSPVSVIRSLLRTMSKGYTGELTDAQSETVDRALHRADFLQTLIDDLLDLAAGKSELTEERSVVPVEQVAQRVVDRYQVVAREKRINLGWVHECEQPARVQATENGIDHIINNLVSNAVKYTPSGGHVSVVLHCADGHVRLSVSDTGIGIPEESLKHLFEEFYRAPNAKAIEKEGTGLGLAITHDLVTRYGGNITAQSKLNEGTTFTVTLPISE
jgi:signal transduction histidine kinase